MHGADQQILISNPETFFARVKRLKGHCVNLITTIQVSNLYFNFAIFYNFEHRFGYNSIIFCGHVVKKNGKAYSKIHTQWTQFIYSWIMHPEHPLNELYALKKNGELAIQIASWSRRKRKNKIPM